MLTPRHGRRGLRPGDTRPPWPVFAKGGLVLSIKILVMASLAVCSLSVDAEAVTIKQNTCYRPDGFAGLCVVNCDPGMVVVGGGCITELKVGISAKLSFVAPINGLCRPTARSDSIDAYAICQ